MRFSDGAEWRGDVSLAQNEEERRMLAYEVLSVVEEIPPGKVASYGQIARLAGRERNARLVGKILSRAEYFGNYPCHRVVNHAGRTAPHWSGQRELLEEEGVIFKENGCVDMRKCQWEC